MESSNTSSWKPTTSKKLSNELGIGEEALLTSSTRELVEFYWTNQKRFSGSYMGFPSGISYGVRETTTWLKIFFLGVVQSKFMIPIANKRLMNYGLLLSLITWYKFGTSIKNNIHQTIIRKPKIKVIVILLKSFQLKNTTKIPKLIIDQGWHQ